MSKEAEAAIAALWRPIDTAPHDGSPVVTAKKSNWARNHWAYPITSRFLDGRWTADFGTKDRPNWATYDPQPTHWMPPKRRSRPPEPRPSLPH